MYGGEVVRIRYRRTSHNRYMVANKSIYLYYKNKTHATLED